MGDTAANQALLKTIIDSAPDGMYVRDPDGTIQSWNRAAEEIYGYSAEEVIGRHFFMLVPEDRRELEEVISSTLLDGNNIPPYETRRRRKDGAVIETLVVPAALKDESGAVVGIFVTARDITEANRIRHERDALSALVDSSLVAIVSLDRDGLLTSWNQGAERLFGYRADEVLGRRSSFLAPEQLWDESAALDASLKQGRHVLGYETQRLHKDGSSVDILLSASPVYNREGEIVGIGAIYQDVTERQATLRELARREAQLNEAQEMARLGSWELDIRAGRAELSDQMWRNIGYRPGEIEITPTIAMSMVIPADRDRLQREVDRAVEERGEFNEDVRLERPDGSIVNLSMKGRAHETTDGRVCLSGTALDTTQQDSLEEQLIRSQRMEALGGLAGGIAHDFNNLLAVILNYGNFIQDDLPADHRSREDLEEMLGAARRGVSLVRQLLSFARREVVKPEPVNLNLLVHQMEPLLARAVAEDIDLDVLLDEEVWSTEADRGQLEQVLLNLVVNARDAMPRGGRITIETKNLVADDAYSATRPNMQPGPYVALIVSDNGVGMDRATQERVFEPFFTTKPRESGTGLGLASAYGIVERAKGHISLYSEVGIGTSFKIYLPATDVPVLVAVPAHDEAEWQGRNERIVVVEDEEPVLALITRILGENGYDPIGISSPQEALEFLRSDGDIDLLLTDVMMPDMSGRTLSEAANVPTIFMSGYTDSVIARQGVLAEGVVFLPKPFSRIELLSVVRTTIDQSRFSELTEKQATA